MVLFQSVFEQLNAVLHAMSDSFLEDSALSSVEIEEIDLPFPTYDW